MADGPRGYAAMWRGRLAYSDDGHTWRESPPGDTRAAPAILRRLIFG